MVILQRLMQQLNLQFKDVFISYRSNQVGFADRLNTGLKINDNNRGLAKTSYSFPINLPYYKEMKSTLTKYILFRQWLKQRAKEFCDSNTTHLLVIVQRKTDGISGCRVNRNRLISQWEKHNIFGKS